MDRHPTQTSGIKLWLKECDGAHWRCRPFREVPLLPSRALQLDQDAGVVSLISEPGLRGGYTALSYCRGGHNPIATTTKTLEKHRQGIVIKSLPPLFQDAVTLTLSMGLTCLWIDALCIVQDDIQEWAQEAARMADVYSNTYITIAATTATGPAVRLFNPKASMRFDFKDHIMDIHNFAVERAYYASPFDAIVRGPLNKRAWYVTSECNIYVYTTRSGCSMTNAS